MSEFTVTESFERTRLDALGEEWRTLFELAGQPTPFLTWEWLSTFRRVLTRNDESLIIEVRDRRGELAGALALTGKAWLGGRRFRLIGNGLAGCDYLDILARPADATEVRRLVAGALARRMSEWDTVDSEDLPCGAPSVQALSSALRLAGATVSVVPAQVCPAFALRGTFREHLLRTRRRETYGRRVRFFERQPGYEIEVTTREDQAQKAMQDFLLLHRQRWASSGGSDGIPAGPLEDFHLAVAPLLAARGYLRLYRLFVSGRPVAAVYGLECGRRFYFYQSGYDPEWAAKSPGLVLLGRTVEDAYERGLTDYDFLRGTQSYKLEWATDRRETCSLKVKAPTFRAGTAEAAERVTRAARVAARAVAPEIVWSALRRARRRFWAGEIWLGAGEARMLDESGVGVGWVLRRAVKVATAGALLSIGMRRVVKAWQRRRVGGVRVVLLSYHRVTHHFEESSREGLPSMFVSSKTLKQHLEVVGHLRDVVSLADARRLLGEGERGPARDAVVITFDDGYADNYEVALPLLAAHNVPATFFLATGYIGTSRRFPHDRLNAALTELKRRNVPPEHAGLTRGPQLLLSACAEATTASTLARLIERLSHDGLESVADALEARLGLDEDDLPLDGRAMNWKEVKTLAGEGMDVGGHTVNHAVLSNLPLVEARREVQGCREQIEEQLGQRPRHFAYPNGYHSPMMRELVRECGFEAGVTTEDRENVRAGDPFKIHRKVLWENSTVGPRFYSEVLAAASLDGVFTALGLSPAKSGARVDPPPENVFAERRRADRPRTEGELPEESLPKVPIVRRADISSDGASLPVSNSETVNL